MGELRRHFLGAVCREHPSRASILQAIALGSTHLRDLRPGDRQLFIYSITLCVLGASIIENLNLHPSVKKQVSFSSCGYKF